MKPKRIMTTEQKLKKALSALQIIQTWASFTYKDLPAGHALKADEVSKLIEKTFKEIGGRNALD